MTHLEHATESARQGDVRTIALHTNSGDIACRVHDAENGHTAVVWVFGAGGGFGGPAGGLYPRLSHQLRPLGVTGIEVAYRRPASLEPCVLDVLLVVEWARRTGRDRIVLVGGGAVVISAGLQTTAVIAVAALSSQLYGAESIADLAPRPVLLVHGKADEVVPDLCSRELYRLAGQPKQLILYSGCRHGLDECRDELDRDLRTWISGVLAPNAAPRP